MRKPVALDKLPCLAFIGGGNMATAMLSGLFKNDFSPEQVHVVEPDAEQAARLIEKFRVSVRAQPSDALEQAGLVVWAVKPQTFKEAALQTRFFTRKSLHISVAAGLRSANIAHWLGTERVVRAMPNTPALIGKGMTGLFARPAVGALERETVAQLVTCTGDMLWVDDESLLDAVTALSGSGPAYVFYFIETMVQAGVDMGLSRAAAQQLAVTTFAGASRLAAQSSEPPELLRQRVTSKGGTTFAAIQSMDQDQVQSAFARALHAAKHRATELGDEFAGQ
jgi:pyrroline-5-carboxylate reductase